MELSLTDSGKLRIALTPFDMIKYDLTCESIDYDDTRTRRALWDIFDTAKRRTGFDAATGRLCIQVYPEKNGGCEIYITKLGKTTARDDGTETEESVIYTSTGNEIKNKTSAPAVYCFYGMAELLSACVCLSRSGYTGDSSAYSEESGGTGERRYYLIIYEPPEQRQVKYIKENLFLWDFGEKCRDELIVPYLREHAVCICEKKAVKTLAELA